MTLGKHAWRMVVRTTKQDSALFYHLLEGHAGLCTYSTLDGFQGLDYRDVELLFAEEFTKDIEALLQDWQDFVTVIETPQQCA